MHNFDEIDLEVDVLAAGTSCKDLSALNNLRAQKRGCYELPEDAPQSGTSGPTYIFGFKKVAWQGGRWAWLHHGVMRSYT